MNPEPKSKQLFPILSASIVFAAIILLLAEPERAMDGAWQGLSLCLSLIHICITFLVYRRIILFLIGLCALYQFRNSLF